jgi:hypothetical protein
MDNTFVNYKQIVRKKCYDSNEVVTASTTDKYNIYLTQDNMIQKYLIKYKIKYIILIATFVFGICLLYKYSMCSKIVSVKHIKTQLDLDYIYVNAEKKLKQLHVLQKLMKNEVSNIYQLTNQCIKKMKDLFNRSESNFLTKYSKNNGEQCEFIPLNLRFDCHPESGASQLTCTQRGCCWHQFNLNENKNNFSLPYCYYPNNWNLYKYENFTKNGNDFSAFLSLKNNSFYKKDLPFIKYETTTIDSTILRLKVLFY